LAQIIYHLVSDISIRNNVNVWKQSVAKAVTYFSSVKFVQDIVYQKLLQLTDFSQSYPQERGGG